MEIVTVDKIKTELNIALTKAQYSIQAIQSEVDKLTFSEDQEGIDASNAFIEKSKKILEVVDKAYKEGKSPHWEKVKAYDEANRSLLKTLNDIIDPVKAKHQALAAKLQQKKRDQAAKEAREKEIRSLVEATIIEYSKRIAAAQTPEELTSIELSISNQKSPSAKAKYGDLHQEAIDAYNERILPLLRDKKEGLKSLSELETEYGDLGDTEEDWEKAQELEGKIGETRNKLMDSEVRVQEEALSTSFAAVSTYTEVLPTVKPKRTAPEYSIADLGTALKKAPECLKLDEIPLNKEKCREVYDRLVKEGKFDKQNHIVVDGIQYSQKKTF